MHEECSMSFFEEQRANRLAAFPFLNIQDALDREHRFVCVCVCLSTRQRLVDSA